MSKGSYIGGSTVIGPWSTSWFGKRHAAKKKPAKRASVAEEKPAKKRRKQGHSTQAQGQSAMVAAVKKAAAAEGRAKQEEAKARANAKKLQVEAERVERAKLKLERDKRAAVARALAFKEAKKIVPRAPRKDDIVTLTSRRVRREVVVEVKPAQGRAFRLHAPKRPMVVAKPLVPPQETE